MLAGEKAGDVVIETDPLAAAGQATIFAFADETEAMVVFELLLPQE